MPLPLRSYKSMVMPARSSGSALSSWKRVNRRDFENNENGKFSSSGYTSVLRWEHCTGEHRHHIESRADSSTGNFLISGQMHTVHRRASGRKRVQQCMPVAPLGGVDVRSRAHEAHLRLLLTQRAPPVRWLRRR